MIPPVVYSGTILEQVNKYNSLPTNEKTAAYWDKTHDAELSNLKEYIKDHYITAQNYTCPYCKQRMEVNHKSMWDAEHIIPKDNYPQFMFTEKNLCVSCKDCNKAKWNKNVLKNPKRTTFSNKSEDYIFCHPHFDDYESHIKIIAAASFYLPKTQKGIETVEKCQLLRFVNKFSNYECVPDEIIPKISALSTELMSCSDPQAQAFLLSAIQSLAEEGKNIQLKKCMEKRFNDTVQTL